ncbi:MAG: DUF790 family protein [candidate division KSB1 bacterium]|nr:DUF790 family protein [candidate division KSB1 bacterium]
MLPTELLRYHIDKRTITPRYITPKYADYYLKVARDVIKIFEASVGKPRRELEATLDEYEGEGLNYKILRGLAHILLGLAEFAPAQNWDYPQFRERVFEAAQKHRPIVSKPDLLHNDTKETVLTELDLALGTEEILTALYGDLPENHLLIKMEQHLTPEDLIRRYNLALAQGLLYRAERMWVTLWDSFKIVFRYLKLAQLMHFIEKSDQCYRLVIDGPFSLFKKTRKYGVNMARFLPGLLLAKKWDLQAEIATEAGTRFFHLNQNSGLHSYYPSDRPFDSQVEEAFYRDFTKAETPWLIERESEIIDLGQTVLIPDFTLHHPDGRNMMLEIVGFWTPEYLQKKIEKLRQANRTDILIAVDGRLNCARENFQGRVLFFKNRVKVDQVLEMLEHQ